MTSPRKPAARLRLRTETLRKLAALTDDQLVQAAGGGGKTGASANTGPVEASFGFRCCR